MLTCAVCGETLFAGDEIALLELGTVRPFDEEYSPEYFQHLRDITGDIYLIPYHLHLACFAEVMDCIQEEVEDEETPQKSEDPLLMCPSCGGTLGENDYMCLARPGELHISKRAPTGINSKTFKQMGSSKPICLWCMHHQIPEHFDEWIVALEDTGLSFSENDD